MRGVVIMTFPRVELILAILCELFSYTHTSSHQVFYTLVAATHRSTERALSISFDLPFLSTPAILMACLSLLGMAVICLCPLHQLTSLDPESLESLDPLDG